MSQATSVPPLSASEERALNGLLDEVIPPSLDARLPGAGALGLAAALNASLAPAPEVRASIVRGLEALHELARARGAKDYASAPAALRRELANALEAKQPGLMPTLAFCLYPLYYQSPRVLEGLGLEGRAPFPNGYELEPFDEDLIAPVRRRPPLFRAG